MNNLIFGILIGISITIVGFVIFLFWLVNVEHEIFWHGRKR